MFVDTGCATAIEARWKALPANQVLRPGVDIAPLAQALQATEPGPLHLASPLTVTGSP